jgi:hypothetical protein
MEQVGVGLDERVAAGADGSDEFAESGPLGLGHGEMGAEIEQGELADGVAGADAADKAEGGIGLRGAGAGTGVDAADEHGAPSVAQAEANIQATDHKHANFMSLQAAGVPASKT